MLKYTSPLDLARDNKAALGVALAAAALAVSKAPTVQADTLPNTGGLVSGGVPKTGGVEAPRSTGNPSEKQMARNAKAQKGMVLLAHEIVEGPVNTDGAEISYFEDGADKMIADSTVIVPTTSIFTGRPSKYRFDVVTGVNSEGTPDLDDVRTITVAEGESSVDSKVISATYANLRFAAAEDDGTVFFDGSYLEPGVDDKYSIVAAANPAGNPNIANFTEKRRVAAFKQARKIVANAILGKDGEPKPASPMNPAFEQPGHPLGATPGEGL